MRFGLVAAASMLAVLPGCSSSRVVELGVVLEHGNCQRARVGVTRVTMEEVAALRGTRLLGVEPTPPPPAGGTPPAMIAISRGEKPTTGYGLVLDGNAVLDGGVLAIRVKETTPTPDSIRAQVMTHPCLVVELPDAPWNSVRVVDADGTEVGAISR